MDNEQRQKIAINIYEATGVMYDKDDPVFALAIINSETNKILISDLEEKQQLLIEGIEKIPSMIEKSLETLISSLEEAEKSFDELAVKHRSILNNQLDETKLEIRSAIKNEITGGISDAICNTNQQLNQLNYKVQEEVTNNIQKPLQGSIDNINEIEKKLKSFPEKFSDKTVGINMTIISIVLCFIVILFGVYMYFSYTQIESLKDQKQLYYNGYTNQKAVIERLPKNVQQQYNDELKKYLKE